MIKDPAVAPYRDASAAAIHPYEGVHRIAFHPAPPTHLLYAEAIRQFDRLFAQALWRWRQMLRQALDDRSLLGAIRQVYRKRPKRRDMAAQAARAWVQRARESAAARVPYLDPVWSRPLSDFT